MRRLALVPFAMLLVFAAAVVMVRGDVPCDVLATQPACEVAMRPGPLEDTAGLITVDGVATFPVSGELLLTTIAVDDGLGPVAWLRARRDARVDVVPRERIFPPGLEPDEVAEQNAALMADSQLNATVAALTHLGYELTGDGARIAALTPEVVTDELRLGDVVVAVGGQAVTDSGAAAAAVQAAAPGDELVIEVRRDGALVRVPVVLGESPDHPGRAFVGVLLVTDLDLPLDVRIDAGRIGGPSAGLMFALSIVDLLTEEDLVGGLVVAGSGTVDLAGTVGGVGGVPQKLVAATSRQDDRPADVFLVPSSNLDQARRAPVAADITVVPVDDLDAAVAALATLRDGGLPDEAIRLRAGGGVVGASAHDTALAWASRGADR